MLQTGTAIASALMLTGLLTVGTAAAEEVFHETFEEAAAEKLFRHTWGDPPTEVLANGAEADIGVDGGAGAHLKLVFAEEPEKKQSYWSYTLPEPMPIVEGLSQISIRVKGNVPVRLKIGIATFGFIYHAPASQGTGAWETVTLENAYQELANWCRGGDRDPAEGFITHVIISVARTENVTADLALDDFIITAAQGTNEVIERERFLRRFERVRVSVATQVWSDEGRTLDAALERIDEAALDGADLVLLPQECVKTGGEPIPGPISEAIAARAAEHEMYVIANIREREEGKTYVTSFLCDRTGEIIGKYRKSHKMPDEDMDLGDELPVFDTDLGKIAMRIGTDRFFADIDHVYTVKGARIILWSQMPEPVDDEFLQDFPSMGRAADYGVFIACARYSFAEEGWITNKFPPYRGCPIGRSYVINREGQRVACTPRKGTGVATAVMPKAQLRGGGRGARHMQAFAALTEPVRLPEPREWAKRKVRLTIIESHLGVDELLVKLDEAGEIGSDLVCLYEFVWIRGGKPEKVAEMTARAKESLAKIAAKAKQWQMYVLIAGVIDRLERNEAILYDREGQEVGRYFKIVRTHDEQICGEETPILETDFGRIGVRICADEAHVEIDRCYGVKGADILCTPTQSWGPDALKRDLRDLSRAMDAGFFLVECTHAGTEARHRSIIAEPTGAIVASSNYRRPSIVTAVVDLDHDRPQRYIREWTPHEPKGYLPQYQPHEFPKVANDLRETILLQRRPELYEVLSAEGPAD